MAEPKVRFKKDDGGSYPSVEPKLLSEFLTVNPDRNKDRKYDKTDVLSVSGDFGVVNQIELQGRSFAGADVKDYHILYHGDVVYTKSPLKENPFGIVKYNDGPTGIVSTLYAVYHCNDNVDGRIIEYYFDLKSRLNNYLKPLVNIGAKHDMKISAEKAISDYIMLPCIEEQQKIADFLSSVDDVITASNEEVANLETQKKAVMKKIFSQGVRFKRADGSDFPEWEEKSIADLGEIIGGGTPKTSVDEYWNGDTPWISSADLEENNIHVVNITRYISDDAIDNSATKRVPKDAILIITRVGVGKVAVAPCELCTSQDYMSVVPYTGDIIFFGYAISKLMQDKTANVQGTSIKGIPSDEIKAYTIGIPCLEEQNLIADFLSNFDEVIAAAKKELELWKELKKGLLQQMFV